MRSPATGSDTCSRASCCARTIPERPASSTPPEYPEYKTDALRIGGDVQAELVNAAIIHRIDPGLGSAEEIMNSLWVRARLVARNNKALIQTVAGRLDRYGFYTGEEIQRILDESMKGLDR